MKLSFVKTLQGHEIEFVRLLYPLRYDLFLRTLKATPFKIAYKQDDQGVWSTSETTELPGWVRELSLEIQEAIEENETDAQNE